MMWSRWHQPNRLRSKKAGRTGPVTRKDPPLAIEEIRRRGSMMAAGPAGLDGQPLFVVRNVPPTPIRAGARQRRGFKGAASKQSR